MSRFVHGERAAREFDIAIVGLGPTGAVLANLCGIRGLRVVVFERSAAPFPEPRACHLDAEVARILQSCGFERELADVLTISPGMEYVDAGGARLFTFEGFEREPLLGWAEDHVFVQPELDAVVRTGLDRFPHVELRLGVEAPALDQLLDTARFVVACDGAGSDVRRALDIPLGDLGYDEEWMVIDVFLTAPIELPGIIQQVCDPARLATFVPSHGTHRRWELLVRPGEEPDPWELIRPWGIDAGNAELVRAARYRFHALVAERWTHDGVLLAGDAAHQMPPFMGQGMCSGIRDAANLAWKLAEVVGGISPSELLDTYERERRPHTEAVIRLSIEAGRLLGQLADDVAAGRPLRLPEPDVGDPYRWSRLPPLDLGEPFPVGHQVPQPWVDGRRLDDLLGAGWAWVAADAGFTAPDDRPVVVASAATMGHRAVLVRPDRYIAQVE